MNLDAERARPILAAMRPDVLDAALARMGRASAAAACPAMSADERRALTLELIDATPAELRALADEREAHELARAEAEVEDRARLLALGVDRRTAGSLARRDASPADEDPSRA